MGKQRKTKKKTRRDVVEIARDVVEQAIGEKLTGEPLDPPEESQKPETRQPWRSASKGGRARAAKLGPKKCRQIARKAARARWNKPGRG